MFTVLSPALALPDLPGEHFSMACGPLPRDYDFGGVELHKITVNPMTVGEVGASDWNVWGWTHLENETE